MKTINLTDYQASFVAAVTAQKAADSISRINGWWTANVNGSSKKLHDIFTVTFGETFARFEITELKENVKIVWHVLDGNLHWMKDKKEWKDTRVVWEIIPDPNGVRVEMTHIGLRPGKECFEDCYRGWNHYVKESLFGFMTGGKGSPDHREHSAGTRQ